VNTENVSTEVTKYRGGILRVFLTQKPDQILLKLRTADVRAKVKFPAIVVRLKADGWYVKKIADPD
jgi:hypothetical protein